MGTRFVLVRHAQSTWNAAGRWQGQADPPLSEQGRAQAEALALRLAAEGIEELVASDLRRAVETAELLGKTLGLPLRLDPRLRELDVGEWAGLTRLEIEARDPGRLERFEAGDPEVCAGGGESRSAMRRRVRAAAAEIARSHPDRCVAVVAHMGTVRALLPGAELSNAEFRRARCDELAPPD